MKKTIKTAILFVAVLLAIPMQPALSAGSLWLGLQSDSAVVYYFAHGYANYADAERIARSACEIEARYRGTMCIEQVSGKSCSSPSLGPGEIPDDNTDSQCTDTGVDDNEAVAIYSNRMFNSNGADVHVVETANTIMEARNMAIAECRLDSTTCLRDFEGRDAGNNNPQIERVTVIYTPNPQFTRMLNNGSGGSSSSSAGAIIGGVVVVGGLIWALSSGGATGELNFSPDFGYSLTESGYSANAGGRMDFHKDNWNLYYTANQTNANANGEFRYASGGTYIADFWTATFSESVAGETADYDLSLSANWTGGIWNVLPVYHLHSEYDKGKTETHNTLNLEGVLRYNRWTIRPAAGFRWENASDFAEDARFRLDLVREF